MTFFNKAMDVVIPESRQTLSLSMRDWFRTVILSILGCYIAIRYSGVTGKTSYFVSIDSPLYLMPMHI